MKKTYICNCGAEYELYEKNYPCRNETEQKCDFCNRIIINYINFNKSFGVRLIKRPSKCEIENEKIKKLFPGK